MIDASESLVKRLRVHGHNPSGDVPDFSGLRTSQIPRFPLAGCGRIALSPRAHFVVFMGAGAFRLAWLRCEFRGLRRHASESVAGAWTCGLCPWVGSLRASRLRGFASRDVGNRGQDVRFREMRNCRGFWTSG